MASSPTKAGDVPLNGQVADKETKVDAAADADAAHAGVEPIQEETAQDKRPVEISDEAVPETAAVAKQDAGAAPPAPASDDAPPLPDEKPPLPNEEPPLPSEEPPLPNEEPPLPNEEPPLPDEPAPEAMAAAVTNDDGWDPVWSDAHQAWYFVNRFTQKTQWENPRVLDAAATATTEPAGPVTGGYNPAIHGDYDPNAWYAKGGGGGGGAADMQAAAVAAGWTVSAAGAAAGAGAAAPASTDSPDEEAAFAAKAAQAAAVIQSSLAVADLTETAADVAARRAPGPGADWWTIHGYAEMPGGASLKAERSGKKPTRAELKAFKAKRRQRKEEKRRAWLLD